MKKKLPILIIFALLIVSLFLIFPFADNTTKQDVKSLYLNQFQISGDTDIYYDNQDVYEVQFAGETIWRAGSEVTYNLDEGNSQMVYYDYAKSVFEKAPSPEKAGWEFIGWKYDTTASPDDIISSCTADSTDFNVYAVFRKLITVTFYNNSTTPTILTDYAYYNNGNIDNPEFNLPVAQRDGWTLQGISTKTDGSDISTIYEDITLGENTTFYSIYKKPLNFTFNANNGTNNSITKNYEVLYYSTGYNHYNTKLLTAADTGFKDANGIEVNSWVETNSNKTYDLGIDCPKEFYSSNISDYKFNAIYGIFVNYVVNGKTYTEFCSFGSTATKYTMSDFGQTPSTYYTFAGWSTNASSASVQNVTVTKDMSTLTLYAVQRHTHTGVANQTYASGCYNESYSNYEKTGTREETSEWYDSNCCSNCQEGPLAHYAGNPYGACNNFNSHWTRTTTVDVYGYVTRYRCTKSNKIG